MYLKVNFNKRTSYRFADKNGDGRLDYEEFMRVILEGQTMSRTTTFFSSSTSAPSLQSRDLTKSSTSLNGILQHVEETSKYETSVQYQGKGPYLIFKG